MSRNRIFWPALAALTAFFTVAAMAVAMADTIQPDADFVISGNQTTKDLGTVAPGATMMPQVTFQLACSGNKHVDNGQIVTLARVSATLDAVTVGTSIVDASTGTIGGIPAAWPDDGTNCPSPDPTAIQDNGNSTVTIHAPASSGPHTVIVTFTQGLSPAGTNDPSSIAGGAPAITFTFTVGDSTPPVIAPHTDVTAEATGAAGAVVNYSSPGTTDNIDPPGTATCSPASGTQFALGNTTVTCHATDSSGNPATPTTFVVHVVDTTAPVIAAHGDETAEATSSTGATVSYTSPATSDAVDGAGTAPCAPVSGSTFALGDSTVTCSATDAHGNPATPTTFKVSVVDTTAPEISVANVSEEAVGPSGAVVTFSPTATDIVDGSVAVTCSPASGSTFALGNTTVDCWATDAHSNEGTASFTVTVKDTTAPALVLPADITAEATGPSGAVVNFTASASDLVDGSITPTCVPASGSTFALGTTTVDCSAEDAATNEATGSFGVTVVDTTPPTLDLPADQLLEATGPGGAVATFSMSASDLVDGSVAVTCDATSGGTFPLGLNTVSCSAKDAHGNEASGSFTVAVQDTTPPVIAAHDGVSAEATSGSGADVSYTAPTTSDAVDGAGTATCLSASGSTFALGDTTVKCDATDEAGNHATETTFVVHVVDTTPPVIASHADVTKEATSSAGATVNYTAPVTSDIVDGAGTATCAPASGSTFALGDTTVTCTASDAHGNAATPTTFKVTVVDTTPPAIAAHADVTAEATSASGAVVNYSAPATSDAVDGAGTATCSPASGTQFALGDTTVTCNATDAHGNAALATTFKVTVVDTTPPTIDAHADVNASATGPSGAVVTYTSPATHDLVDGAGTATCTPASGSLFALGNTTVTCSATDAHGNAATPKSFVVHVVYTWTGFFQPVDNNGVFNTVKAGQAIPIKFNLGGNQGLSIFKTGYPLSARVPCNSTAPTDLIEQTVTAGSSSLVYDTLAQQYVYVWKTDKAWAGTCRVFDLGLIDGTSHTAYFNFTK